MSRVNDLDEFGVLRVIPLGCRPADENAAHELRFAWYWPAAA
jgi:hypothetical protein